MSITGVGSSYHFIYNTKTGKLSTKDGSENEFVDFCNGDVKGEDSETLNHFDKYTKYQFTRMLYVYGSGMTGQNPFANEEEVEITADIDSVTQTNFYVNGQKIFTGYTGMSYLPSEIKNFEINEAGNGYVVPDSIQQAVLKRYEEKLSGLLKDESGYRSNSDKQQTYQIGGQSFTEKEWNELVEKIDRDIEQIKAEQEERLEELQTDETLTKEQKYKLFTDANERALNSYGPNAPEKVKKAWMEAVEKTGVNGAGMAANGMVTHITAMSAERAVRWINGDPGYADILGDTVDSAITAAEKALYDLENPLQPVSTRSPEVQKQIEKEQEFYQSFLENLKQS